MSGKESNHKESWYQAKIIRWLKETYPQAFVWKAGNVLKKLKGSDEERKKGERKGRKGNGNEDIDNKMSALRE